jgi:TonB family protein
MLLPMWNRVLMCLVGAASLSFFPALPAAAEAPRGTQKLVVRTVERIAELRPARVLLEPIAGCALDDHACASFDAALRDALREKIGGIGFVEADALLDGLRQKHFLAIDRFVPDVLQAVMTDAGADLVVTEDITWEGSYYAMRTALYQSVVTKEIAKFSSAMQLSERGPSGRPILIKDPDADVSFILWNKDTHHAPLFKYPKCFACPDPPVSVKALTKGIDGVMVLMATINEEGKLSDVTVVRPLDESLVPQTLSTMRMWSFNPAIDANGKPFPSRVRVTIDFDELDTNRGYERRSRHSRSALTMTDTELKLIAAAANIGLSSKPKNG